MGKKRIGPRIDKKFLPDYSPQATATASLSTKHPILYMEGMTVTVHQDEGGGRSSRNYVEGWGARKAIPPPPIEAPGPQVVTVVPITANSSNSSSADEGVLSVDVEGQVHCSLCDIHSRK